MRKKETDPRKNYLRMIAAAWLRSKGFNQTDIAKRLGIGQSEVCRLLQEAVEKKLLSRGPALLRQNISDEDYKAAEQAYLNQGNLAKVLKPLVPSHIHFEVWVAPGNENTFASSAADRVVDVIVRSRRIGIMWGRSVCELVHRIVALWGTLDHGERRAVQCIPLCGDPLFLINDRRVEYSASHLAAMLEKALDPNLPGLPCLSGIPAYISYQRAQESGTTLAAWRRFFAGVPGYHAIFGGTRDSTTPLIRRLDTIITGVGTIALSREAQWRETGDFIKERLDQDRLSKQEMHHLIYGDIGGTLLPREGLSASDVRRVDQLNAGWMGMRLAHVRAVARMAAPGKAPGVIVVAYGPWKAETVKVIIQLGLVNQLIVDPTLAETLAQP